MNKKQLQILTLFFLVTLFSLKVNAQTPVNNKLDEKKHCVPIFDSTLSRSYYTITDKMPSYRGGKDTLMAKIRKNLKWPGKECCYQGTVIVSFIIESEGQVTNKKIVKGYKENGICKVNEEALKVINFLTEWTPGQCEGETVPVQINLPIKFSLR